MAVFTARMSIAASQATTAIAASQTNDETNHGDRAQNGNHLARSQREKPAQGPHQPWPAVQEVRLLNPARQCTGPDHRHESDQELVSKEQAQAQIDRGH
jgi:hypothetical protein